MSKAPTSIPALIDEWDTITGFAADVGCGYEAARKMHKRQRIAPEHWQNVVSAAKAKGIDGVSFEWLAQQRVGSGVAA